MSVILSSAEIAMSVIDLLQVTLIQPQVTLSHVREKGKVTRWKVKLVLSFFFADISVLILSTEFKRVFVCLSSVQCSYIICNHIWFVFVF